MHGLRPMGYLAAVVAITFASLLSFSCKLNKSDRGNSPGNSGDAAPRAAVYVSCHKDVDGAVQHCFQYDIANLNPIAAEAIKGDCGRDDKGLDGFVYSSTSCPIDNQIGKCSANQAVLVFSDFYYSPGYSVESASKACADSDGTWSTF